MRSNYTLSIVVVVLLLATNVQGSQYALLVGINKYAEPRAQRLHGAVNDVKNMRQVLVREYGFPDGNIHTLTNEEATLAAIRDAFREMSQRLGPDDIFVFHFSGHGTWLPDDNGDELRDREGDRRDEALCPYDCLENKENALRDDELGQMLDRIRAREVVVILDSCNSGTGTKALSAGPGAAVRLWPEVSGSRSVTPPSREFHADSPVGRDVRSAPDGQRRIVFSACTATQLARELEHDDIRIDLVTGSLTYYLIQGLRGPADVNGDGVVTYGEAHRFARRRLDEFFNGAVMDDHQRQSPLIETDPAEAADAPVFGAAFKRPMQARITTNGLNKVILDLGGIHGIKPRQRFGVYLASGDRISLENSLATIEITKVDFEKADAKVIAGELRGANLVAAPIADPLAIPNVRLLTVAQARGGERTKEAHLFVRELNGVLSHLPRVRIDVQKYDLKVTVSQAELAVNQQRVTFRINASNGRQYDPVSYDLRLPLTPNDRRRVRDEMLARVRKLIADRNSRHQLASITNPRPGFGLQIAINKTPKRGETLAEFRQGDGILFGIKATADCWYYAVVIDPHGKPKLWYPIQNEWNENSAPAGKAITYPGNNKTLSLEGPEGVYIVKLFATREKLSRNAFIDGLPRADVFQNLNHKQWSENSVSFRVAN
jgi:uncharacterized caspase-like protein